MAAIAAIESRFALVAAINYHIVLRAQGSYLPALKLIPGRPTQL